MSDVFELRDRALRWLGDDAARILEEFSRNGVVVIENVLSDSEVDDARRLFHTKLASANGVDHEAILNGTQSIDACGVRLKSPAASCFYSQWKLDVALHPRVVEAFAFLLCETFENDAIDDLNDHDEPLYKSPFGRFDHMYHYVDRVCYRFPDHIRAEGGLGVHVDRNPIDPYANLQKWRPFQSFVALTDMYGGETSGGLRVTRGFHRRCDHYDWRCSPTESAKGEFYRIPNTHDDVVRNCMPVDCAKGALVVWDNRLPHATASKFQSADTRECVYVGFLPDVPSNRRYVAEQRAAIIANRAPPAYAADNVGSSVDRDWDVDNDLTTEQRRLLMLD